MKTKEELNALKEEVEALNKKLHIEMTVSEVYAVNGDLNFTVNKRAWRYERL